MPPAAPDAGEALFHVVDATYESDRSRSEHVHLVIACESTRSAGLYLDKAMVG